MKATQLPSSSLFLFAPKEFWVSQNILLRPSFLPVHLSTLDPFTPNPLSSSCVGWFSRWVSVSLSHSSRNSCNSIFIYMKTSCHGFSLIYFEAFSSYGWWWWWWWWWFLHSLLNPSSLHLVSTLASWRSRYVEWHSLMDIIFCVVISKDTVS